MYKQDASEYTVPSFLLERYNRNLNKRFLLVNTVSVSNLALLNAICSKVIESLGYEITVLSYKEVKDVFDTFGYENIFFEDYLEKEPLEKYLNESVHYVQAATDVNDILNLKINGVKIGKYSINLYYRTLGKTHIGLSQISTPEMTDVLANKIAESLRMKSIAEKIINDLAPDIIMINETSYTCGGPMLDTFLNNGIPAIVKEVSITSGQDILKRFAAPDTFQFYYSLSDELWEKVSRVKYEGWIWDELYLKLLNAYKSCDWYSMGGVQFGKRLFTRKEIISSLNLDSTKKTAIIFCPMFWDAPFFGSEHLFLDNEEWFVETMKCISKNPHLNWIVKSHPTNKLESDRTNHKSISIEQQLIEQYIHDLSDNIKFIPSDTNISTFSLYGIADFCVVVRSTCGLEASAFGIPTLTAVKLSQYNRRGFTCDFSSKGDYIKCLSSILDVPQMTTGSIELARKFAHALFIMRPIQYDLFDMGFNQDEHASFRLKPLFKDKSEFEQSMFVKEFKNFIISQKEDYIKPKYRRLIDYY